MTGKTVTHLLMSLHDHWHIVFMDNWFTSIPLGAYLLTKSVYIVGTIRTNRFGMFVLCLLPAGPCLILLSV